MSLREALGAGVVVLDGAMSTELERHGVDTNTRLWGSDALLSRPDAVSAVHREYLAAGARVVETNSYQGSVPTLEAAGLSHEVAVGMVRTSAELARAAVDDFLTRDAAGTQAWVAGSVGPYGAHLADGSEYTGAYSLTEEQFADFHRERIAALVAGGVDVLAIETMPRLDEVLAVLRLLEREFPGADAWVSFSAEDGRLHDGTPLAEAASGVDEVSAVVAVGVNCLPVGAVSGALAALREGTSKPMVAYPNSGEVYDPRTKSWSPGPADERLAVLVPEWVALGARLVGGCCRTNPGKIRELAALTGRR